MTDHLADARAAIHSASRTTDVGTTLSWLTTACGHILDHLEAQQTPLEGAAAYDGDDDLREALTPDRGAAS